MKSTPTHSGQHARWPAAPGRPPRGKSGLRHRQSLLAQKPPGKVHPMKMQETGTKRKRAALKHSLCVSVSDSGRSCFAPLPCFAALQIDPMESMASEQADKARSSQRYTPGRLHSIEDNAQCMNMQGHVNLRYLIVEEPPTTVQVTAPTYKRHGVRMSLQHSWVACGPSGSSM